MKPTTFKLHRPLLAALRELEQLEGKTNVTPLVDAAWDFSCSVLWKTAIFSHRERAEAKAHIRSFLLKGNHPAKAFVTFCQRILIARQLSPGCVIALPSIWLSKVNPSGFSSTKEGFEKIKVMRQSLPAFQINIKALAEAILEYVAEPTTKCFHHWMRYFKEQGEAELMSLFMTSAILQHHKS
jgi:hypothetical protein